jgi:phage shock protein PspC (stress-responsive transcriptional regulator)
MSRPRLTRSETDRVIAGVCSGLAAHFDLDPVLIRVAFVVGAMFGPGLIAYIVLWIAVPKASEAAATLSATGAPPAAAAVHIAEERFARGEITAGELATIRTDLLGSAVG